MAAATSSSVGRDVFEEDDDDDDDDDAAAAAADDSDLDELSSWADFTWRRLFRASVRRSAAFLFGMYVKCE